MGMKQWGCLGFALVCLALPVQSQQGGTSALVASEADLISILEDAQDSFQGISPPSQEVFVAKPTVAIPVDWSGFDKKTLKYMTAYMDEYGLPRYSLLIYEDSATRDRVIRSASTGYELARIPAPIGYNPESYYSGLISRGAVYSEFTRWVFDPAHTAVQVELVPTSLYASYEMNEAQSAETTLSMTLSVPPAPDGGATNVSASATSTNNGDVVFTFNLPAGFGSHAEIFKTTNLKYIPWSVAENRLEIEDGAQQLVWTDIGSSNQSAGFFILSDASLSSETDSDGDGFSDLRELYISGTDPSEFNLVDGDSDGMADFFEVMLFGGDIANQSASDDYDSDGLANGIEMMLHPAVGTNAPYVTFSTRPEKYDTDGDGMHDGLEVTYPFLDPNDPTDKDFDNDGLDNLAEYNLGTELDNWDTDGDTLSDFAEYQWGTNPLQADDLESDADEDGLTLGEEYANNTNPFEVDSDGDGSSDGDEVAQGSSPTDDSDGGIAPIADELMTIKLTVGDSSGSHSERYRLKIDGERTIIHENAFGEVDDRYAQILKGKTYTVTLQHIGTTEEHLDDYGEADYDFTSNIEVVNGVPEDESSPPTVAAAEPEVGGTNQVLYTPQATGDADPVLLASAGSVAVFTGDSTIRQKYGTTSPTTQGPMSGGAKPTGILETVRVGMERAGNPLGNDGYAFITSNAEMPDVVGKVYPDGVQVSVDWNCSIIFDRPNRNDNDSFADSGEEWSMLTATAGNCYGGKATLLATISGAVFTNIFHIRGINPSEADATAEIGDDPFFAKAIARHESGTQDNRTYLQFNGTGESGTLTLGTNYLTDLKYTPNRSSDMVGWGIFQLTDPVPTTDKVWSWKSNVSAGLQAISTKQTAAESYFNAVQRTYPSEWESPPVSYTPPSCSTSLTAVEAATIQLFNGGAVTADLLNQFGTTNTYASCWKFLPNNSSGNRWQFVPNQNDYVKQVIVEHENP